MFGVQQFSQSEIYGVSTRYPTIGSVGYPVSTRTWSDKMYRVHHLPPESSVFCTFWLYIPPSLQFPETGDHYVFFG